MPKRNTSLRAVAPEITLARAKAWRDLAGITAVTEITALDRLEVPIFAAERPNAGADVFTYGKGLTAIDSEIGAHMEAIEFHFAEPGVAEVDTRWSTIAEIEHGHHAYAPRVDLDPAPGAPILLALAREVTADAGDGAEAWIPAEMVFNPPPDTGFRLHGASSNGLASGNTVLEASLHALFELIERDIRSIDFVRDASALVTAESLPPAARQIIARAETAGLRFLVRFVPNDYGLPFLAAFVFDPAQPSRRFLNGGWGCHLDRSIALMRAVTEAAQSRAAFLHGSRAAPPEDPTDARLRSEIHRIVRDDPRIDFNTVPSFDIDAPMPVLWTRAVARLRRVTAAPLLRIVLTPADAPLHVARLVVPGLENFSETAPRVGPRLSAELERAAREDAPD